MFYFNKLASDRKNKYIHVFESHLSLNMIHAWWAGNPGNRKALAESVRRPRLSKKRIKTINKSNKVGVASAKGSAKMFNLNISV